MFSEASSFFNDHKLSIRQDCCCKSVVACLSTPFQTMKWGAVDRVGARRQTGQVAIEYHVLTPPKYGPSINRTSVQRILIQFCFSSKPNQNHEALGKLYILSPPLKKKREKKILGPKNTRFFLVKFSPAAGKKYHLKISFKTIENEN